MSFSGGGGMGGASETLSYMIRAYDMATPVFKAFGAQVDAVTRQMQAALAEMNKALATQSKAVTEATAKESASLGELSAAYKRVDAAAAASAGGQEGSLGRLTKAYDRAGIKSVDVAKMQADAAERSTVALDRQAAAAERVATRQKVAAAQTEAAAVTTSHALQRAGRDILLASAATVAGTIDMAAHFQANTLRMQTQAGATAKGLDQIRTGLLRMAGQVGATPNQLANGMYHVVSALNAVLPPATRVRQELAIMKVAAEGAQVGHSNLEETTYALSSALNALHKNARDAGTVMGQLNAIVGAGDMTMQDLIDSFKSGLIPAANSFHISLQSVGSALSVMGDMGMRGALAGTRLRMAISLMAAPTKQAAGILESLGLKSSIALSTSEKMSQLLGRAGVSVTQLSYDLKKPDGIQVALADLNQHLKSAGLNSTAAGAAISRAFGGGRMGAAITLLAENTDRLKLKFDQIGVTGQSFGSAWQKTSETFRVQVDRAVAAVEALGIKIGDVLVPYATKGLHVLEEMANWLTKNQIVLEALGAAFISFSSVAIGSYFVSKIKGAMGLMQEFGHGVANTGRWLFGLGGGGAPAASPGGGPLGSGGGGLTGLFGYMGSPLRVGTMMNPLAVVMSGAGLAGGASSASQANLQRMAGVGPAASAAESQAIATESKAGQARLDQMMAQQAAMGEQMSLLTSGTVKVETDMEKLAAAMAPVSTYGPKGLARAAGPIAGGAMPVTVGSAVAGEQLALGGIATGARPGSAFLNAGGSGSPFKGQTMGLASTWASGLASDLKAGLSTVFSGVLRGGLIAGMGALVSQLVGSAIGGHPGQTVQRVGTGASFGAGAGALAAALIPGIGPLLGPIIGAVGGGLVTELIHILGRSTGQKDAATLTPGFGGAGRDNLQTGIAKAIDEAKKLTAGTPQLVGAGYNRLSVAQREATLAPPSPEQVQKAQSNYNKAGNLIAGALEKGWNQYKFQSEPTMFTQLKAEVHKMPPQVQAVAIQSAIAFASGLEKSGKLAKGSADSMLAQVQQAFPGFTKYLGLNAQADVAAFTKSFDFSQAEANLKKTLTDMRGDFPQVTAAMDNTVGDAQQKAAAMVVALKGIVDNGTGPMKKQAQKDLTALTQSAGADFSQLAQEASDGSKKMKNNVASNTAQVFQIGTANFKGLATNIANSVGAGAEATKKGLQNITDQVNAALKGFGGGKLSTAQVASATPAQLAALVSGQVTAGGFASPHAHGGWVGHPSARGRDEVPIVVGRGEAILKHQDQAIVNSALARTPYRSLSGVFAATSGQLHHMGAGGYVDPIPGFHLGRTDMGIDASAAPGTPIGALGDSKLTAVIQNWFAGQPLLDFQLLNGPDAGRFWYVAEQIAPVTEQIGAMFKAGQMVARFASHGTGIEIGWAANASGTTLAAATTGYHEGQQTAAGGNFRSFLAGLAHGQIFGGGFGVAPQINEPKVTGTGGIADIVRANLKKATAAANTYVAAKAGSAGGGAATGQLVPGIMGIEQQAAQIAGLAWNPAVVSVLLSKESGGGINEPPSGPLSATGPNQVIPSTFAQYKIPGHGNINNPLDNAIASDRYIKSRYGSFAGMAAQTGLLGGGYHGYGTGGQVDFAGGFKNGGMFTTNRPTLALFGEGGTPETVMAFQAGGVVPGMASDPTRRTTVTTGPKGTTVTTTTTTTTTGGGEKTTTSHRVTQSPKGTTEGTTITTSPIKPPKPPKPKVDHFHWGFDPLTGQIEYHDTAQWQMIHAKESQQRSRAAAAKKAYSAWLAQKVTDVLTVGGQNVGDIQQTRRSLMSEHLPLGSPISLLSNLNKLPTAGFKQIQSALSAHLGVATTDQNVQLAGQFTRGMTRTGPDAPLFREINKLTGQMNSLNQRADKRQQQADHLHALALTEHGKQRQTAMHQAHADHLAAQKLREKAAADGHKIAATGDRIAASRPAQLGNAIIQAAAKGVTGTFTAQQAAFQRSDTIAQLLGNVPTGSTAASLGLSATQLKASGLTAGRVRALAGSASGPGALVQQIQELTSQAIPQYQQDAKQLSQLYQDSLRTHNKKLQASLLSQLDAVTQAQLKAYGDLATAQVNLIESTYQQAQAKASAQQASSDILGAIQNLSPGTDLGGLGLSPQVLQGLGVDSTMAAALEGSSATSIQDLQSQQGGKLTADQIAKAQSGAQAQNQILGAQRATDISALTDLENQLPNLKGTAADAAQGHITDLTKSVLSLTDEMNKNTDAVTKLTQATNQNTSATGAMTGQVAYSYQGQGYIAGVGLSSDQTMNLGGGL